MRRFDSDSSPERYNSQQLHLWPLLFPFRYLGFTVYEPEVFHGVGGVAFIEHHEGGLNALDRYTSTWMDTLNTLDSRAVVQYNSDTDFDDSKRLVSEAPVYSPFVRQSPGL